MIDAGDNRRGTNGAALARAILERTGIEHLDHVVLSHYDADHIGGFVQVGTGSNSLLRTRNGSAEEPDCVPTGRLPTQSIIDIGPPINKSKSRSEWQTCVRQIVAWHPTVKHLQTTKLEDLGHRLHLGDGIVAKIVSGRGHVIGNPDKIENADSVNEMSIAVLVSNRDDFDFLVTGDLISVPDNGTKEDARLEDALADALADTVDLEVCEQGITARRTQCPPNSSPGSSPKSP